MSHQQSFAVWITGIPAAGKSSITRKLVEKFETEGIRTVVLESDEMRKILTPDPTFAPEERDRFYHVLASIGSMITRNHVSVIFDATANKRAYRDFARSLIPKFLEAYVQCPLEVCVKRDPKGLYQRASQGTLAAVPGLQIPYEPPVDPDIRLDGEKPPEDNADTLFRELKALKYV
jgi:adenylylsulfate kinase